MKLWIDDQLDEPDMVFRHVPIGFVGAKSSEEAIRLTKQYGVPEYISFDHDLGEYDNSITYIKWLIENYYDSEAPEYSVHSVNPIGKANIISYMNSWKKSKSL